MARRWAGITVGLLLVALVWSGSVLAKGGLGGTKHDFSRSNPANPFKSAKNACDPCHQYLKISLPTRVGGFEVQVRATAVCLSCHSDTASPEVAKNRKISSTHAALQHPVDKPMPVNSRFRRPEEMPELVFFGKDRLIGCATCHDTHNGKGFPKFLRMSNEGDALCMTCHNH